jgi:RimJ/RimL family protein N-acetyltransferase
VDELTTDRLLLRAWRDEDKEPFAAMNADPEVMAHFPSTMTREESDALADRFQAGLEDRGWGPWALERRDSGEFIGFTGLVPITFEADFTPAVEVGWRLAKAHWRRGYATEAGRAALAYGFEQARLTRIVSLTTLENTRSEAVMIRLGLVRVGEFDHPRIPVGHRLRRHVLYAVEAEQALTG